VLYFITMVILYLIIYKSYQYLENIEKKSYTNNNKNLKKIITVKNKLI